MTSDEDAPPPANENTLGLLGQQIRLAIGAYRNPVASHYCSVRDGEFTSEELFTGDGERRFLAFDSLPGTVNVKAIGIDAKTLFVELTPFDRERFREIGEPSGVRIDSRGLWRGHRKLAGLDIASSKVAAEHGPRALWTIPWPALSVENLAVVIAVLDSADVSGAYIDDPSMAADAPPAAPVMKLTMELRMDLQLRLIQTQVPILSLGNRLENRLELGMHLELQQLQRFETWLEKNPADAIEVFLKNNPGPEGERRVAKMIEFKLARDVKNAAERTGHDIDWPHARKIVRRLLKRCA